jgi:antitoxin component YwqK of YwqJK toxin-antitoxin module
MKTFLTVVLLSFSLAAGAVGQIIPSMGFTNKEEAKNLRVNGKKEGKWVEYFDLKKGVEIETKNKNAPIYRLTVYKAGKPNGIVREYYRNGELCNETLYLGEELSMA